MRSKDLEEQIILMNEIEIVNFCMDNSLIRKESFCSKCNNAKMLCKYKNNLDGYAWRCMYSICPSYKNYGSIRENSFFKDFSTSLKIILRIVIKYGNRQPLYSIKFSLNIGINTIKIVLSKLIKKNFTS